MRKLTAAAVALIMVVGLVVVAFLPADAQDDTDARISALETQVALQATQISQIQKVLVKGGAAAPPSETANQSSSDSVTVSGAGVSVSEDFELAPGRYQVTATWQSGIALIVLLWDPNGGNETLFNELVPDAEGGSSTVIYVAQGSGSYFVEVSNNDGPWSITFEPR